VYIGERNNKKGGGSMDDSKIVQLYWDRDEQAISATADKYGSYCISIAKNILGNTEDAEECVNDTYLSAWNSIPPHKPNILSTFLGKITRNLSFNKYKYNRAEKRGGGDFPAILDELSEIVSGDDGVEQTIDDKELISAINTFLNSISPKKRFIFIRRYWYSDKVSDIAIRCGIKEGSVSMTLNRLRKQLQKHLTERGYEL